MKNLKTWDKIGKEKNMAEEQVQKVEEEKKELSPKEQLPLVSERIKHLNVTKETCLKLIEEGSVKIISAQPPKEGEDPLSLDVSGEIVSTILAPVINVLNKRKEDFLAYKENLLSAIEAEVLK